MGRQHQGMDRPGVRQVPEGSGEQGKIEKTGCKIICGAPTTLAVKGLMMMMMNLLCPFGFGFDGTLKHAFKGAQVTKRDTMTPLNAVWELEYHTFLLLLTQVKVTETVYRCISYMCENS